MNMQREREDDTSHCRVTVQSLSPPLLVAVQIRESTKEAQLLRHTCILSQSQALIIWQNLLRLLFASNAVPPCTVKSTTPSGT